MGLDLRQKEDAAIHLTNCRNLPVARALLAGLFEAYERDLVTVGELYARTQAELDRTRAHISLLEAQLAALGIEVGRDHSDAT